MVVRQQAVVADSAVALPAAAPVQVLVVVAARTVAAKVRAAVSAARAAARVVSSAAVRVPRVRPRANARRHTTARVMPKPAAMPCMMTVSHAKSVNHVIMATAIARHRPTRSRICAQKLVPAKACRVSLIRCAPVSTAWAAAVAVVALAVAVAVAVVATVVAVVQAAVAAVMAAAVAVAVDPAVAVAARSVADRQSRWSKDKGALGRPFSFRSHWLPVSPQWLR